MTRCLVLNASHEQLNIVSWRRALTLLVQEKADMLEVVPDTFINSANLQMGMPLVVRLRRQVNRPFIRSSRFTRARLFARDEYSCQYCGATDRELNIDHVLPRSRGGGTNWENCVAACTRCNHRKANKTPAEAGMALRRKPVAPRYDILLGERNGKHLEIWRKYSFV